MILRPSVLTETIAMNEIISALKIPDAIKSLPTFSGNPRLLYDFINNVEEILEIIAPTNNTPLFKLWLRAIRNKITDDANEVLDTYGTPLDWNLIKNNLISHYSDKRNETSLIKDLHSLKQYDTIELFYSKVLELLSLLQNQINIHEHNLQIRESKSLLFREMCLNVFLSGLKEPIGSVVRARAPKDIKEALEYCINEQNIHYARREFIKKPISVQRPNNSVKIPQFLQTPQFVQSPHFIQPPKIVQPSQFSQFPYKSIPTMPRMQNSQPVQKQFTAGQYPKQYKPTPPTPMDVDVYSGLSKMQNAQKNVTPKTQQSIQFHQQQPSHSRAPPQFIFEELTNTEVPPEIQTSLDNYEEEIRESETIIQEISETPQIEEQDFQSLWNNTVTT